MKIFKDITETIGNTPLVRINRVIDPIKNAVLVKLEGFNPCSSVKDRVAVNMVKNAVKNGHILKDTTVIEPTSGNTGIGLAMTCSALGLKLVLVMPDTMSQERKTLLRFLGAKLIETPGSSGMKGCIDKAYEIKENTVKSFIPYQFSNPDNPAIHIKTTAREILEDTEGKIDMFVAGVGTGGTFSGVMSMLKSYSENIEGVVVEPENSAVISGESPGSHKIQGIGAGFIPKNLDTKLIDFIVKVSDEEAYDYMSRMAKEEGIFCGISSGAVMAACKKLCDKKENHGKTIVAVLPDTGDRYLSLLT